MAVGRRSAHHFHEAGGTDEEESRPLFSKAHSPAGPKDTSVEEAQRRDETLQALRSRTAAAFDASNAVHEGTLRALWGAAFPGDPFEATSARWGELGFQGKNPLSDLRAAGFQGLQHLTQFLIDYRSGLPAECRPERFPLALASVTCTAMLQRYLTLHPTLVLPGCDPHVAAPTVVDRFLDAQQRLGSLDALQLLHSPLLRRMGVAWSRVLSQDPDATIMAFPLVLRSTYNHLHYVLSGVTAASTSPWDISAVMHMIEHSPTRYAGELGEAWPEQGVCIGGLSFTLALLCMLAARMGCAHPAHPGHERRRD